MKRKNILFGAIATIAVCLSIVVGATFALFTSTSEVNVAVTAGTVQVTATIDHLETSHQEWNAENAAYETKDRLYSGTSMLDTEKQILTLDNIVPSDKAAFTIDVKNDSAVPVKYRTIITSVDDNGLVAGLKITVNGVEFAGSAVTAWTDLAVGGTIDPVNVSVELPLDAGVEYQGKSCILSYKVEAVQGNGKVLNGVTFTSGKTILNNDINVGEVNDGSAPAAILASGADTEVTIIGGNYNGGSKANNKCIQVENGATVTIKDGYFTVGSDATGIGNSVVETWGGNVIIEGGRFETDYAWKGFYYVLNQQNKTPGTITVKGGTFVNYNPAEGDDYLGGNFVADGYHVEMTLEGGKKIYTVKPDSEITPVETTDVITGDAEINNLKIKTTKDGDNVAAVNAGAGANVIINGGYYLGGGKHNFAVKAADGANVTINGGVFNGGKGGDNQSVHVRNGAKVTIKDGYFTVGGDANDIGNALIESNGGEIVIEGGFFKSEKAYNGKYYVLNQKNDNPGTITVTGGTFVNYNPAGGDDNRGGNFVADGYKVVESKKENGDIWYTVVPEV